MTSSTPQQSQAPLPPPEGARLPGWASRIDLGRRLSLVLVFLAIVAAFATYYMAGGGASVAPNPVVVSVLLLIDFFLLLAFIALIAARFYRLWQARVRGSAGSRLHVRLMLLFSVVALAPAIIVAVFSLLYIEFVLQNLFNTKVRTALDQSVRVAEAYIKEHRLNIRADVLSMAQDINRYAAYLRPNSKNFDNFLDAQASLRNLSEAIVINSSGDVLARSNLSLLMETEKIDPDVLKKADEGEIVFLPGEAEGRVRALIKLERFVDAYLYVGRFVDASVIALVAKARKGKEAYERLQEKGSEITVTFAAVFAIAAVLLLLAALWFALVISARIVEPVGRMVRAVRRIQDGDLSVRLDVAANDEIGTLSQAINRMAGELETQRAALVDANAKLDERRRFTETVLAGVTAGVIGLDREGRIDLPNRSALRLLAAAEEDLKGRDFARAVPEMADLLAKVRERPSRVAQGQVRLSRQGVSRHLLTRVAAEYADGGIFGFVVTFDDVTELVSAQRTAAWADVARRIAHEIKNPLTPIQLSAERLRRRYLRRIDGGEDKEIFEKCIETIIRQVGDIGRMVDEFSAFARMPRPAFADTDLRTLVRDAVFMQQVAHPDIEYEMDLPEDAPPAHADPRQFTQVLTNLLQNAAEAIEARRQGESNDGLIDAATGGWIGIRMEVDREYITLIIEDNGKGLPEAERDKLTEPYVTTRAKGTGLGLAIVKKILEEHGGDMEIHNRPEGGARVILHIPLAGSDKGADKGGAGKNTRNEAAE